MVSPLTTAARHRRNNNSNKPVAQLGIRRRHARSVPGLSGLRQPFRPPYHDAPLSFGPPPLYGSVRQHPAVALRMEQGRRMELIDDPIESSPSQPLLPQKRQLDSFNLCATGVVKFLGPPPRGKVGQPLWVSPTSDRSVRQRTNPSTMTVMTTHATTTTTTTSTTTGRASSLATPSLHPNVPTMNHPAVASSTASSSSLSLGTKQPAQVQNESVAFALSDKENVPAGTIADNQDELQAAEPNNTPHHVHDTDDNEDGGFPLPDDGEESEMEDDDEEVVKGRPKRHGPVDLDDDDALVALKGQAIASNRQSADSSGPEDSMEVDDEEDDTKHAPAAASARRRTPRATTKVVTYAAADSSNDSDENDELKKAPTKSYRSSGQKQHRSSSATDAAYDSSDESDDNDFDEKLGELIKTRTESSRSSGQQQQLSSSTSTPASGKKKVGAAPKPSTKKSAEEDDNLPLEDRIKFLTSRLKGMAKTKLLENVKVASPSDSMGTKPVSLLDESMTADQFEKARPYMYVPPRLEQRKGRKGRKRV